MDPSSKIEPRPGHPGEYQLTGKVMAGGNLYPPGKEVSLPLGRKK
jgi:hypothetical protein